MELADCYDLMLQINERGHKISDFNRVLRVTGAAFCSCTPNTCLNHLAMGSAREIQPRGG